MAKGKSKDGVFKGFEAKIIDFETSDRNVVFHPSGVLRLDYVLGGGLPEGRFMQLFGSESSGKCLTKDHYVLTPNGYKTVAEIFKENELEPYNKTDNVEKVYPLINRYKEVENTTHFTFNGKRPLIKINTKTGVELKVTANHPLLVINEYGFLVWKQAQKINTNDYLVQIRDYNYFGSNNIDKDISYFLGVVIADGSMQEQKLSITNDDPSIKDFLEDNFCKSLDDNSITLKQYKNNEKGSIEFAAHKTQAVQTFYKKYELQPCVAKEKYVPKIIRESDRETVKSFIQGYMDCESFMDISKNQIEVTSASKKLLTEVKLLLQQFGIISSLTSKKVKSYPDNQYWRLLITGNDFYKYIKEVGTRSDRRKEKLIKVDNTDISSAIGTIKDSDSIPNIYPLIKSLVDSDDTTNREICSIVWPKTHKELKDNSSKYSYRRLNKIIEHKVGKDQNPEVFTYLERLVKLNYFYDRIVVVEKVDPEPTFDFSMGSSHSFIANGVVSHNTAVASHFAGLYQRQGKKIFYIDAENAFDPNYIKRTFGFDVTDKETVYFSQENSAATVFSMIKQAIPHVDLIIIDSTDSLQSMQAETGEIGDANVGGIAKISSDFFRHVTKLLADNHTSMIAVSQERDLINMSGYGGGGKTTSGGKAWKFYASIRLEVIRVGMISVSDEIVGQKLLVKCVKNKVAPPFRKQELSLKYYKGFEAETEIFDIAKEIGIITNVGESGKGGAWYWFDHDIFPDLKESKWQGQEKLIEWLKAEEQKEFTEKLTERVKQIMITGEF